MTLFNWAICLLGGLTLLSMIGFYFLASPALRFWNALLPIELALIGLAIVVVGLVVNAGVWAATARKRRHTKGKIAK